MYTGYVHMFFYQRKLPKGDLQVILYIRQGSKKCFQIHSVVLKMVLFSTMGRNAAFGLLEHDMERVKRYHRPNIHLSPLMGLLGYNTEQQHKNVWYLVLHLLVVAGILIARSWKQHMLLNLEIWLWKT